MLGLTCPECKAEEFDPVYEIDNYFICAKCGKPVGYYCDMCEKFYDDNRLGKHGDVWECKLCGKIQWGYTEWKRALAEG